MNRKLYYLAFIDFKYQWWSDWVNADKIDEYITQIQVEHMKNRLVGGYRGSIPFQIKWKLGEFYYPDYNI